MGKAKLAVWPVMSSHVRASVKTMKDIEHRAETESIRKDARILDGEETREEALGRLTCRHIGVVVV